MNSLEFDHLAREQPPLDPPLIEIVEARGVQRCAQHQLRRVGVFLLAPQLLDLRKEIAGVVAQFVRNGVKQRPGVGGLVDRSVPRPGQRHIAGAETFGRAHRRSLVLGGVGEQVHPSLLISARDKWPEQVERRGFGVLRHRIAAEGFAHQALGIGAIATCQHGLGECEASLGRNRRFVFEPRPDRRIVALVVPQRGFQSPAQEGLRGPARIGGQECAVAFDAGVVVVAAQDEPFGELPCDGIADRGFRLRRVVRLVLADEVDHFFDLVEILLRRSRRRRDGGRRARFADRRWRGDPLSGRRGRGCNGWRQRRAGAFASRCRRRRGRGGLRHHVTRDRPRIRERRFAFRCSFVGRLFSRMLWRRLVRRRFGGGLLRLGRGFLRRLLAGRLLRGMFGGGFRVRLGRRRFFWLIRFRQCRKPERQRQAGSQHSRQGRRSQG